MRPVRRGGSPQVGDFTEYEDAKAELMSRLGHYCSYCERRIVTLLAVEHIQPKGLAAYTLLQGRWSNLLLACANCNSTKRDKDVILRENLLPDRDNTFAAYRYAADGKITIAPELTAEQSRMAGASLALTGLDKPIQEYEDANGRMVAVDRVAQRKEAWGIAERARNRVGIRPELESLKEMAVELAAQSGHFSVWMTVFDGDSEMRNRLIDAFAGTRGSGCFDAVTGEVVRPAPNPDGLADGGKV